MRGGGNEILIQGGGRRWHCTRLGLKFIIPPKQRTCAVTYTSDTSTTADYDQYD